MDNSLDNSLHQAELLLTKASDLAEQAEAKALAADKLIQSVRYAKPHAEAITKGFSKAHIEARLTAKQASSTSSLAKSAQAHLAGIRPLP